MRDRCRTDVGGQKLIRLVDLLKYGNSVGKSFGLEIKVPAITDAQAECDQEFQGSAGGCIRATGCTEQNQEAGCR
jgi:hypothetical protein